MLAHSVYQVLFLPPDPTWVLLATLTIISGLFTIRVPSVSATISVSETFIFASVLLFGPSVATVIVASEALIMSAWRHRRERRKVLFNVTEAALSIWIAATVFRFFIPDNLKEHPRDISSLLGPMLLLVALYFLINSWLTATAVGLVSRTQVSRVWREHFSWLSLNYLVGGSVALMIVQTSNNVGLATLGIILPFLAISYFTMKLSMGRLDDANNHIAQIEKLYLSTVESLAMAIDAKDQVTHGHIRRVQALAVGTAKVLGVNEPQLLKAIEASALLHDMGKLAVPEHILNKPGKLTESEFECMKLHTTIGAEILSSIDFPYPVVPIVRHHHENWDGTGYPDGLHGANIPIGARILSVVDCFDALTSDRPYRRRLSDVEALNILRTRRGSMYDPLVVDTFCNAYPEIRPAESNRDPGRAFMAISHSRPADFSGARSPDVTPSTARHIEPAQESTLTPNLIREVCSNYLEHLFPGSTCAVYELSADKQNLSVALVAGPSKDALLNRSIVVGTGVSGWVAANRQTAINSDPHADLGELRTLFANCISAPIPQPEGDVLGVVTVYGSGEPFSTNDESALSEAVSVGRLCLGIAHQPPIVATH